MERLVVVVPVAMFCALLAGGWALVILWQAPPPSRAKRNEAPGEATPVTAPDESLEIAVGPITGPLGVEADEAGGASAGEAVGG